MSKIKSQKAFTLIELLVVMAIIAILSAIMFGPIQTARRRSKDTQAVADMKLLKSYLTLYALDHNGLYPTNSGTSSSGLEKLSIYGSLPSRSNLTYNNPDPSMYNYTHISSNNSPSYDPVGYHLWTHLNDMNEAFNSDADCNSGNTSLDITCWDGSNLMGNGWNGYMNKNGKTGTDNTGDGSGNNIPSITVCKNQSYCILDYTNNK